MIITKKIAENGLNYGLHIIILFTFLLLAFYLFLSKIVVKEVDKESQDVIDVQIPKIMTEIYKNSNPYIGKKIKELIPETAMNEWASQLVKNNKGKEDPHKVTNNSNLFYQSVGILTGLVITWVLAAVYFTKFSSFKVSLLPIILENIATFTVIAAFELYFFVNVATKYIPIDASSSAIAAIEKTKEEINTILGKINWKNK